MKQHFKIVLLIAVLSAVVYANSFSNSFVWDDEYLIVKNVFLRSWRYLPSIFKTDVFHFVPEARTNFYRPGQTLSYLLDYSLWRLNPFGYHLTSVLYHALNAVIVYFLSFMITGRKKIGIIVALLFAVHPVHTAAIAYISGRADALGTLFALAAVVLYVRAGDEKTGRNQLILSASVMLYLLSILAKEAMVIMPLMVMLYDGCFARGSSRGLRWRRYFAYWAVGGIYLFLRIAVLNFTGRPLLYAGTPFYFRLATTAIIFFYYLRLLFIPVGLHMEWRIQPVSSLMEPAALIALISLVLIGAYIVRQFRHSKKFFFGASWFVLGLLPVSNIVPLNAQMAEHWLYFPSVGFFLAAAVGIDRLLSAGVPVISAGRLRRAVLVFFAAYLVWLSGLTVRRNSEWKDDLTIYRATLKYSPGVARVHFNLGNVFLKQGKLNEAVSEYQTALRLDPGHAKAHNNLGSAYLDLGRREEALSEYRTALKLAPGIPDVYSNMGGIYLEMNMLDESVHWYQKALEIQPLYKVAHYNLGIVYNKLGREEDAVTAYKKAIEIDPEHADAYCNLGSIYLRKGMLSESLEEYKKSLAINPKNARVHSNAGIIYLSRKQIPAAINEFKTALVIDPAYSGARIMLAECYFLRGEYELSRVYVEEAMKRDIPEPWFLEELERKLLPAVPDRVDN